MRGLLVKIVEDSAVEAVQVAFVIVVMLVLIQLLLSGFLPGNQRSENAE